MATSLEALARLWKDFSGKGVADAGKALAEAKQFYATPEVRQAANRYQSLHNYRRLHEDHRLAQNLPQHMKKQNLDYHSIFGFPRTREAVQEQHLIARELPEIPSKDYYAIYAETAVPEELLFDASIGYRDALKARKKARRIVGVSGLGTLGLGAGITLPLTLKKKGRKGGEGKHE